MKIYFPGNILGLDKDVYLKCEEDGSTYTVVDRISPNEDFFLFTNEVIEEISGLFDISLKFYDYISSNLVNPFLYGINLKNINTVPWEKALRKKDYEESLLRFLSEVFNNVIRDDSFKKYYGEFRKQNNLFSSLMPARTNKDRIEKYLNDANAAQVSLLESFLPEKSGYTKKPLYNRHKSKTGRMIIEDGPRILNIRSDYRNIIESRFGDKGRILSYDYKSLEPRVILIANHLINGIEYNDPDPDLYQYVLNQIGFDGKITREDIKILILSKIYGAGKKTIENKFSHLNHDEIEVLFDKIEEIFNIELLRNHLNETHEYFDNKKIYNLFYRNLFVEENDKRLLINHFIQSSAVDIAVRGFNLFVEQIKDNENIIPLYVIHDELILDVHVDAKNEFLDAAKRSSQINLINNKTYNFYYDIVKI